MTGACKPRHRNTEFLAFLKQVARAYPDQDLHLVMDNYAAHKHPNVKAWLEAHPRVKCHFTPTHASWMNLVEVWFGIIERQAIHRGTFRSVKVELLIIDDWFLTPPTRPQVQQLHTLIDRRHKTASTIYCTQLPPGQWHDRMEEKILADAIVDRITTNAHATVLHCDDSMRKHFTHLE